jgi:hypothetical protein
MKPINIFFSFIFWQGTLPFISARYPQLGFSIEEGSKTD